MTIAVDLDGVIHQYSKGWYDGTIYDPPIPGAIDGLRQLMSHEAVFIFTTRDTHQTVAWLHAQGLPAIADSPISARVFWDNRETLLVTNRKLAARAYLDDRAIRFTSWNQALHDLLTPADTPADGLLLRDTDDCRFCGEPKDSINHPGAVALFKGRSGHLYSPPRPADAPLTADQRARLESNGMRDQVRQIIAAWWDVDDGGADEITDALLPVIAHADAPAVDHAVHGVQAWMALDLHMALGRPVNHQAEHQGHDSWANWWADLCAAVRVRVRQAQEMSTWRATANALDAGGPGTPRTRAERAEAILAALRIALTRAGEGGYSLSPRYLLEFLDKAGAAAPSPVATDTDTDKAHPAPVAPKEH